MKKHKNGWLQAALAAACAVVLLIRLDQFGASEFSGGSVTGPLFTMAEVSSLVFVSALGLGFFYPRVSGILTLTGSALCAPLYLFVVMPGAYVATFAGEYSVPPHGWFAWSSWAMLGLLTLVVASVVGVRTLLERPTQPPSVAK